MRAFASLVGLVSSLALACAAGAPQPPLRLEKKPFLDTGLHRLVRTGPGELFLAPDLDRVRARIRESKGAIVSCQVVPRQDAPGLAQAKQAMERELCTSLQRALAGLESPAGTRMRIATSPAPDVLRIKGLLIDVEGDAHKLVLTRKSTLSLRFAESVEGKPVLRYYEIARSAAEGPLDGLVATSLGRLYALEQQVLQAGGTDVASSPR